MPYALNADKLDGYDASELSGGSLVLPSGAVVWFRAGSDPAVYTKADALGLDIGPWNLLASRYRPGVDDLKHNVWTGSEALCWEGDLRSDSVGGRYDPVSDNWTPITTIGAPITRHEYSAVWTGSEMIIWGGQDSTGHLNTGARYNPDTDSWTPMTVVAAPLSRTEHSAIWTGSEMVVWGGVTAEGRTNTGGCYDPSTDSWTPITMVNAPLSRSNHLATWTGSEMIIWAGVGYSSSQEPGALYDPSTDSWRAMDTEGEPDWKNGETDHYDPLWTGSEMVLVPYGLRNYLHFYDPVSNAWRKINYRSSESHSSPNALQRAPVVAGNLLVTYDGIYDLAQDEWVALAHEMVDTYFTPGCWTPVVWTGDEILILGGYRNLSHTIDLIYPYVKD